MLTMEVWNVTTGGMSSGSNPLASAGDAHFFEDSIHPSTIRSYFIQSDPSNPTSTPKLTRGMKWLLASMSKGRDVSDFFPHVVKLTGASSLEVRKLVYMYLVHYADHDDTCRELALLSINSFQRGLADSEQLIRALALRALTSVRVSEIIQIQILGVQTCARDRSPYVRKCAANALAKLAPRCDPHQRQILLELLQKLLDEDVSTMVLSSAVIAFSELCPQELHRLHGCFRKLCHLLTDVDEFGQVVMMEVLTRYCRLNFTNPGVGSAEAIDREKRLRRYGGIYAFKGEEVMEEWNVDGFNPTGTVSRQSPQIVLPPHPRSIIQPISFPSVGKARSSSHTSGSTKRIVQKAFYSDEEDESFDGDDNTNLPQQLPTFDPTRTAFALDSNPLLASTNLVDPKDPYKDEDDHLDEDHRLLLRSSIPLLKSRNSAVVLAVCSLHYYCGVSSIKTRSSIGKALVRIQRDKREIQYVILTCIKSLTLQCPSAFAPFLSDFFVKAMDPSFTRQIKLDILTMLALEPESITAVLQELRTYIRHHDKTFVQSSIRAVGKIAELAQIVHDRRGRKLQAVEVERKKAITVVLNCLHGLEAFFACSRNPKVLGECVIVIRQILVQLQCMAVDTDEKSTLATSGAKLIDDPNQVQSVAMRRLFLLVLQSLAPKQVKDKLEEDILQSDNKEESEDDYIPLPPDAVAAAIWVVGELYLVSAHPLVVTPELSNPKIREKTHREILRGLAKNFPDAEPVVQLQAIHLATKSIVLKSESKSTEDQSLVQLCGYILDLGKHDINPDVRDRARYESAVVQLARDSPDKLSWKSARNIFLHTNFPKPSHLPIGENIDSLNEEAEAFPFGTLSSLIGHRAGATFLPLPPWSDRNTPSSLRDPSSQSTVFKSDLPDKNLSSKVAPRSFHDESSEESSSSSSTDDFSSSSETEDESSTVEESSSGDESSDDESDNEKDQSASNAAAPRVTQSTKKVVEEASESDNTEDTDASESDNTDDSDTSEFSEDSNKGNDGPVGGAVENLLALDLSNPKADSALNESSIGHGLEGLVMAPIVHDSSSSVDQEADVERNSCAWKRLVRHELGGGLEVSFRYLRGQCAAKQAKLLNLSQSAFIAQLKFENRRNDFGILRHIRVVQRSGGQGGPKKVAIPQEIAALGKNQFSIAILGIDFGNPTSDRDGFWVARMDIKSDRGTNPVEFRPSLAEMLIPLSLNGSNFDRLAAKFTGSYQKMSFSFTLDPSKRSGLPRHLLKHANLGAVDSELEFSGGIVRFGASLPFSSDSVLVSVKCDAVSGSSELVIYCDNAIASTSIMDTLKRAIALPE